MGESRPIPGASKDVYGRCYGSEYGYTGTEGAARCYRPPMRRAALTLLPALAIVTAGHPLAQNDWVHAGQDPGATKFSTLAQINTDNVKNLKRAWTFHTGDTSGFFESGLLVVDGVMYFSAQNGVYALDARHRQADLEIRGDRHGAPRAALLAGRQRRRAAHLFADSNRAWPPSIRRRARSSRASATRASSPASGCHRRRCPTRTSIVTQGGNSTVKAWDAVTGEAAVDAEPQSAARRSERGDLVRRQPEDRRRPRALGLLLRRRRARPALRPGRESRQRLLRRPASRQQPLQRLPARRGHQHRQDQVVPAARPSRHLGLSTWPRRRRSSTSRIGARTIPGVVADHEDGHHVRLQSRDRRADVRHGRAAGAADDGRRVSGRRRRSRSR